ncbi:MAG: protease complex subunit PrcB family protein [Promethearchaeota archaeon]
MKSKLQLVIPLLLIGVFTLIPSILINIEGIADKSINFETIAQGWNSDYTTHEYIVIDSQVLWVKIWDQTFSSIQPQPETPYIDFTQNSVIAVFSGFKPTGGYSINITKIRVKITSVYVYVENISPPPEVEVPAVITFPYHIIKTQKLFLNIIFQRI